MKTETLDLLEELGMNKAADDLKEKADRKRKLVIAYEHFRYVKPEQVDAFNERLKKQTMKREGRKNIDLYEKYDQLTFGKLEEYASIPPMDVLEKVVDAKKMDCFDEFEVAKIESMVEYKDPIIFGRIKNCPHRFFVAQWDDDVKITDLLKANEG